jgi:hypothetical protein
VCLRRGPAVRIAARIAEGLVPEDHIRHVGGLEIRVPTGLVEDPVSVSASASAPSSATSNSIAVQMAGWSSVVPPGAYRAILRTVRLSPSSVPPVCKLSAIRVPSNIAVLLVQETR